MTEKLHLRCSALPLAFLCPGSARRGPLVIDEDHEGGRMGTAVHEALAAPIETGRVEWNLLPALAKRHGVDETELRSLVALGAKLWESVRESFPNAETELEFERDLPFLRLTGHVDGVSVGETSAQILDHKTGRKDSDYSAQALGYCALVLLSIPDLMVASCTVLWVRDQEVEHYSMTREQLDPWLERLRAVADWDGTWRTGDHCHNCRRAHECPARRAVVRRDVEAIAGMDLDEQAIAALTPEQRIDLVIKARAVAQIAERFVGAIKADVAKNGDCEGGGKKLTLQKTERRSLRSWEAFPVLQEKLDDAEMAQVTAISLVKAEEIVRSKAPRGKGAGAVRELNEALAKAGAISTTESMSLVVRRATSD